jgi:tetratricopeptide (TPR) repeat protein
MTSADAIQAIRTAVEGADCASALPAFTVVAAEPESVVGARALLIEFVLGLFREGKYAESLPVFAAILKAGGASPIVALRYGQAAALSGNPGMALRITRQILDQKPDDPAALLLRAECFSQTCRPDQIDQAAEWFQAAHAAQPDNAAPLLQLARIFRDHFRLDEAIETARRALAIAPDDPEIHSELAHCLTGRSRLPEARFHREQTLLASPENPAWLTDYAQIRVRQGEAVHARAIAQLSDRIQPGNPHALYTLANIAMRCEQMDQAQSIMDRALACHPGYWAKGEFARALMRLMTGEIDAGWKGYDHRLAWLTHFKVPDPLAHRWDGGPVRGTLLIHTEQGIGDTVQFCRFLPQVREKAGPDARIVVLIENLIRPLIEASFGDCVDEWISPSPGQSIECQYQAATGSLPGLLSVRTEADLCAPRRYLKLPGDGTGRIALDTVPGRDFHVGIAWTGNPEHPEQAYRALPLEALTPVFDLPGVQFHALHLADDCDAIRRHGLPGNLSLYGDRIVDLADTAGLIDRCDLIVSVDTSAIHLAGALGKPAVLLLPRGSEFRWMQGRADTPWYESVAIVRQRHFLDWSGPIAEAKERITAAREALLKS